MSGDWVSLSYLAALQGEGRNLVCRPDSSEKEGAMSGSDGKLSSEGVEPRNILPFCYWQRQEGIVGECCGAPGGRGGGQTPNPGLGGHRIFLCPPTHPQKLARELQTHPSSKNSPRIMVTAI